MSMGSAAAGSAGSVMSCSLKSVKAGTMTTSGDDGEGDRRGWGNRGSSSAKASVAASPGRRLVGELYGLGSV